MRRLLRLATILLLVPTSLSAQQWWRDYCISGQGEDTPCGWILDIGDDLGAVIGADDVVFPVGAGPWQMANLLADDINANTPDRVQALAMLQYGDWHPCADGWALFRIILDEPFRLYFEEPGGPGLCQVDTATYLNPCPCNPLAYGGPSGMGATVPTLSGWGVLGLAIALLGGGAWMVSQRRSMVGS